MTGLPDTERRRRRATLANPSRAAILWEEGSRKYSLWTRPEGGEGAVWEGLGNRVAGRSGVAWVWGRGLATGWRFARRGSRTGAGPRAGRSRAASLGAGSLQGGDLHLRPPDRGRGLRAGRRRGGGPGPRTSKVADRAAAARPSLSRNVVGQLQLAHAAGRKGLGAGDAGVVLAARPSASTGVRLLAARAADLAGEMSAGRMDLLGLTPAPSLGSGPVGSARLRCPRPRPVATPVPLCPASSTPETRGDTRDGLRRRGDLSHLLPELRPQGAERPVARGTTLSSRTFHFMSRGASVSAPPERLCPGTRCFAPNFLLLYGASDVTPMPWLSIFTDASCPRGHLFA